MEKDEKKEKEIEVDGILATGKQFDLDVTLPEDNRNVVYGVVRDKRKKPIKDAVVKLVEIVKNCGKKERRPVSHTFTDENGEFVFGPLCDDKDYEINIWVDQVRHTKVCKEVKHDKKCLKGFKIECDKKEEYPDKEEGKPEQRPEDKNEDYMKPRFSMF